MKQLPIAFSIGLALACGSAFAADMPVTVAPAVRASAPPQPAYTWTGCYINGGLGYGMWKQDHYGETLTPLTRLTPTVSAGGEPWVGTAGAGCDYQTGSRWLVGAFGDYNLMSLVYGGSLQEPYSGWIGNETAEGAWAVGGRIGYLLTPKLLAYLSAGYTQTRFGQINLLTNIFPQVAPAACGAGPCFIPAHADGGWFIGSGMEYALWDIVPVPGLFWRMDYRYIAYNGIDLPILTSTGAPVPCTGIAAVACGEHTQKDAQTVTTGLVWRFNVDGPPSGSAFAADIPATAAPAVGASAPAPPVYRWTGCYINGGAGYGMWEQDEYTWSPLMVTGSTGGEGWVATVGVGCDYQIASRWVIGLLADYDFMHLSGYFKDPFVGYIGEQTGTEAWAVGGRVGYLLSPNLLAYVNFGYPLVRFDRINLSSPYFYPAQTYMRPVFFMGAGTEYALGDIVPLKGLFWRTEYRYADDGGTSLPLLTTAGLSTASLNLRKDVQTITSGFVWRFNFDGP